MASVPTNRIRAPPSGDPAAEPDSLEAMGRTLRPPYSWEELEVPRHGVYVEEDKEMHDNEAFPSPR